MQRWIRRLAQLHLPLPLCRLKAFRTMENWSALFREVFLIYIFSRFLEWLIWCVGKMLWIWLKFAKQLSIAVEENVVCVRACVHVCLDSLFKESLLFFLFFFLNSVCLLHYGRKHSEWIFQAAHEIQDKTMTHAFHLEADNIPVTFPGKCQGLDRFMRLAVRQSTGNKTGEPSAFPSYAKECHCDSVRAGTKSICKWVVFTSMECQTGGVCLTGQHR